MPDPLESFIADRLGVVRRRELHELGQTERSVRAQVADGVWQPVGAGILVHHTAPQGLRTDSLAVGLRLPGAILTGPSAALLLQHEAWQGQRFLDQCPVVIAARAGRGGWRTVRHPGAGYTLRHGVRVADHHTTLIDLLRTQPWSEAAAIGAAAVRSRLTSPEALLVAASGLARAAGVQQLRRIASALADGAESGPEIDLHLALRKARIRGWVANPTLHIGEGTLRPDIAFTRERLAIEYDGRAAHGSSRFHPDRERQNTLVFDHWLVLRVTSEMLYPPTAREQLLASIARLQRERRRSVRNGAIRARNHRKAARSTTDRADP